MVWASWGAVVGKTIATSALPLGLGRGGTTAATPGLALQRVDEGGEAGAVGGAVDLADDLQGTVEPGSEALGQQVVGLRVVDEAGSLPASVSPRRRPKNGRASTTITTRATTLRIGARPSRPSAQRSQKPCSRSS